MRVLNLEAEGSYTTGFFAPWIHYSGWIRELTHKVKRKIILGRKTGKDLN